MACGLLVIALVLAAAKPAIGRQPQDGPDPPVPLALVVTYADGRVANHEGGPRGGGFWTPMFPRTPIAPVAGQLPVSALKCDWKREGDHLQVAVSVLLGEPHQQELAVATTAVRVGQAVTVSALSAFGVAPIKLSAKPIAPVAGFQPRIINRTAGLEVTAVDVVSEPIPGYRVSVTNLSSKGARSFSVKSFVGGRRSLSGREGDPESHIIIPPGDTYTFDWRMSSATPPNAATWGPMPIDAIEIGSVLWDDGTFEGEREPAISALMLNAARRQQLIRVVGVLHSATRESIAPGQLVPWLLAQAEALPILGSSTDAAALRTFDPEGEVRPVASLDGTIAVAFQQVRNALLDDIRTAARRGAGSSSQMAAAFMKELLEHYEAWLDRVGGPR